VFERRFKFLSAYFHLVQSLLPISRLCRVLPCRCSSNLAALQLSQSYVGCMICCCNSRSCSCRNSISSRCDSLGWTIDWRCLLRFP
ncbi:hypothetical protein PFISCL1PPCAC_8686, partial [Pristionchus fissidentatus]